MFFTEIYSLDSQVNRQPLFIEIFATESKDIDRNVDPCGEVETVRTRHDNYYQSRRRLIYVLHLLLYLKVLIEKFIFFLKAFFRADFYAPILAKDLSMWNDP